MKLNNEKKLREAKQLKINFFNGIGMIISFIYTLWMIIAYGLAQLYYIKEYGSGFELSDLPKAILVIGSGFVLFLCFFIVNRHFTKKYFSDEKNRTQDFL